MKRYHFNDCQIRYAKLDSREKYFNTPCGVGLIVFSQSTWLFNLAYDELFKTQPAHNVAATLRNNCNVAQIYCNVAGTLQMERIKFLHSKADLIEALKYILIKVTALWKLDITCTFHRYVEDQISMNSMSWRTSVR